MNEDRSATLILRVWLEGDAAHFRGRLAVVDTSVGPEGRELTVAVTSSTDDAVEAVRAWLDDFLGQDPAALDGLN